jgi:hypothetical protein
MLRSWLSISAAALLTAIAPAARAEWDPAGVVVCDAAGDQVQVATLRDGANGAYVAWVDRRSGTADVYLLRLTATGQVASGWPADGVAVSAAAFDQIAPALAADGAGGVYVAWYDDRSTGHVAIQRMTGAGVRSSGWPVDGLLVGPASFRVFALGTPRPPVIHPDGGGGAWIAWEGERDFFFQTLVQRIGGQGTPPAGWPAGGTAVAIVDNDQVAPCMITTATGAIVAWDDYRRGEHDIYAQAVTLGGGPAPGWPAAGLPLCIADSAQTWAEMVADGSGGAIVTWMDLRTPPHTDIYAQRLTGAGTIANGWTPNGVAVCTAFAHQRWPKLVEDGLHGAIIVWQDERSGIDIYAARIRSDGTREPSWPANGLAVCSHATLQRRPVIGSDGQGGAIIAWEDERFGGTFHAQHVIGSAGVVWPVGGVPAAPAGGGTQKTLSLAGSGPGRAIVAWQDDRGVTLDIYAQLVEYEPPRAPTDVRGESNAALVLEAPRPNPAHGSVAVRFALPRAGTAEVAILDPAGRRVRTLARSVHAAGAHSLTWNGTDEAGGVARAGLYWLRLSWAGQTRVQRLAWLP